MQKKGGGWTFQERRVALNKNLYHSTIRQCKGMDARLQL